MKDKFFFIIILVLLSVISLPGIISTDTCNCADGSDCIFSDYFCDEYWFYHSGCDQIDNTGLCIECRSQGETCYWELEGIESQCCSGVCVGPFVAGKEVNGFNTGTQGHCCPTDFFIWAGDGCIKLGVSPSSQDFGIVEVGSCLTKNFQVTNTGTGTLTGSTSVNAPFSCDSGCDYTLTGGQTKTVKIKFCPAAEQSYSRTVNFNWNSMTTQATVTGQGEDPVIYYTLTVSKTGIGSGTVTGPGISCGSDCSESYESGTSVTLSANAAAGSTFAGWSGACSGTGSCTVTMNSAKTVTATFNKVPPPGPYLLTISKTGTGSGTVTSSPAGINCGTDCSESYSQGTSVTLSAVATAGSTFTGWAAACSGTGSCIVTMNSDKNVIAMFIKNPVIPPECDLTSASWGSTEVIEGNPVDMNVQGNDCTGEALSFNIYRSSTYIETVYDVFPSSSWQAEPASSTPYYFISKVVDNPSESATSNNLLVKEAGTPQYCDDVVLCSHYLNAGDCENNICNIDVQDSVPNVDCSDPEINCVCIWDDNECKGSWTGSDNGYCGDGMINPGETCDGSDWGPITGCSDFNNFTGGILDCDNCKFNTSECLGGVPGGICGDGVINPGETCDGSDWGLISGCSDFNNFTGGILDCYGPGTTNECLFDTSLCTSPLGNATEVGTCIYTQYTNDDCEDGFLTFSWTVQWVWDPGCDIACQQQNQNMTLQCVDGQRTVECPAQIPLPFFNIYSFVATLVIIVIIYVVMNSSKKKRIKAR